MPDPAGNSLHESPDDFSAPSAVYQCPDCGHAVPAVPRAFAHVVECPACGGHLVIPAQDGSLDLPDEDPAAEVAAQKESELDSLRVRNVIALRRTAMRSRTYAIVGAAICLMSMAKLVLMAYAESKQLGWHAQQISYLVIAATGLLGVWYFMRRAAYWGKESRPPRPGFCAKCGHDVRGMTGQCPACGTPIPPAEPPPDFSALSDGSQHVTNLERLK